MIEITNTHKEQMKATILFINILGELNMNKMSKLNKENWNWHYQIDDDEETTALKWLYYAYGHRVVSTKYSDDIMKYYNLKPVISFIKLNNYLLKDNCYDNDWSKYTTDNTKNQNLLKYLLCNLDSKDKYIMNLLANNIDNIDDN